MTVLEDTVRAEGKFEAEEITGGWRKLRVY